MSKTLQIGTRGSKLALWQTRWVAGGLQSLDSDLNLTEMIISTTGDVQLDKPLSLIGGKGLFTKELDNALLDGRIDVAVHSLKDLPTEMPDGLQIAAIPVRVDCRDALISKSASSLTELPEAPLLATGSVRRSAQVLTLRPDARIVDIRGNVDTRLRKFVESDWDAMILAVAGLERLGLTEHIAQKIPVEQILPAVGQGCLAVVCRADDNDTATRLKKIEDYDSERAATAERALLHTLNGGCHIPIGSFSRCSATEIELTASVSSPDGGVVYKSALSGPSSEAAELGRELANRLLKAGANELLDSFENPVMNGAI